MKFCPSTASDIQKYYRQTFVKFTELGDKLLYVQKVEMNEVLCVDSKDDAFVVELREDEPYEMNYTLPHRGLFLCEGGLYQLRRIPARQWRRGICSDNTLITNMLSGKNVPISFDILEAFTNKPVYQQLSAWKEDNMLLSQRFAVLNTGAIFCDRLSIGNMEKGRAVVQSLFAPEIKKVAGTTPVVAV